MDSERFDDFTESLVKSRRGALKTLFGAAVAGVAIVRGGDLADAAGRGRSRGSSNKSRGTGRKSGRGGRGDRGGSCKSAGGTCYEDSNCCAPDVANSHAVCTGDGQKGVCVHECDDGFKDCNGACIPATDCCDCGGADQYCDNGTCVTCAAGQKVCNDTCIPDTDCCGGCPAGQECQAGVCMTPACNPSGTPCEFSDPGACCSRTCILRDVGPLCF